MQMKNIAVVAMSLRALAMPTERQSPIDPALQNITYTVMALRSASPVHFLQLNAIAGRLYLGGNTTSYCPENVQWGNFCPPGNVTVFKDSCSLDSQNPQYFDVPAQTLWNTDDGVIGYDFSQPRPENTYNCPWYLGTSANDAFAATIEATYGASGFLACPTREQGIWQVLRDVTDASKLAAPLGDVSQCLGISLVAISYNTTDYGAWVYT